MARAKQLSVTKSHSFKAKLVSVKHWIFGSNLPTPESSRFLVGFSFFIIPHRAVSCALRTIAIIWASTKAAPSRFPRLHKPQSHGENTKSESASCGVTGRRAGNSEQPDPAASPLLNWSLSHFDGNGPFPGFSHITLGLNAHHLVPREVNTKPSLQAVG